MIQSTCKFYNVKKKKKKTPHLIVQYESWLSKLNDIICLSDHSTVGVRELYMIDMLHLPHY